MDKNLVNILVCPETKQPLEIADAVLIEKLNAKQRAGDLINRSGQKVTQKLDSGFVRKDGKYLYPVRDEIPIMLIDEAVSLDQV